MRHLHLSLLCQLSHSSVVSMTQAHVTARHSATLVLSLQPTPKASPKALSLPLRTEQPSNREAGLSPSLDLHQGDHYVYSICIHRRPRRAHCCSYVCASHHLTVQRYCCRNSQVMENQSEQRTHHRHHSRRAARSRRSGVRPPLLRHSLAITKFYQSVRPIASSCRA